MPARIMQLPLVARTDLGGGYHLLELAADEPLEASAGQFAMLRSRSWGAMPLLPRPMSLLAAGSRPTILVKVVGEGTGRMASGPLGERWQMLAPLGVPWPMPAADVVPVLVAGGVGVAPLVALAEQLVAAGRRDVRSLYGGRAGPDLPLGERLAAAGSLGITTEDGSRGTPGVVTALLEPLLAELAGSGAAAAIYACGPHAMMAAVARLAERHGQRCHASLEARMGCGLGVCLGCAIPRRGGGYLYACAEGPCVDATAIDWAQGVGT